MRPSPYLAAALLVLAPAVGFAAPRASAGVSVTGAWVQTPLKGGMGAAAYLAVRNTSRRPERLLGASSPAAASVSLHSMSMADGVMRMRKLNQGLEIPPGATATLQPGGDHLMMTGARRRLASGDRVPITLRFQNAGEITLEVPVQGAAPSR